MHEFVFKEEINFLGCVDLQSNLLAYLFFGLFPLSPGWVAYQSHCSLVTFNLRVLSKYKLCYWPAGRSVY